MGIFDSITTCSSPFNPKYEWELAAQPVNLPGFEWIGKEIGLGWTAGACKDWMARMWAVKQGGLIAHSGNLYRHPGTNETRWTYFGAPEGARVSDPSADPFVAAAEASGFVFAEGGGEGGEDEDESKPPAKAGFGWLLGILGVGALVTVIVAKAKSKKESR